MRLPCLLLPLLLLSPTRAQDDVLTVERREDLRAHAKVVDLLRRTRVTFAAEDMTAKELCRMLTAATANQLDFLCSTRDSEAAPRLELDLKETSLWSVLAIAQQQTGLRFVYRFGVVMLTPAERVKPLTYLELYDLRAAFAVVRSFPGPDLRLRGPDDDRPLFPEEEESTTTVSGLTADEFERLLRESVRPDAWGGEGVTMNHQNGLFLIRQTPQVHREIQALLVKMGLRAPRPLFVPAARRVPAQAPARRGVQLPPRRTRISFDW